MFFIFIANGILSFWVPNLIEDIFKDPAKTGLIISFSSLIGFLADMALPQILRGISVRSLILWSIVGVFIFSAVLLFGMSSPLLWIFLLAMAIWGIYYEFMMFSEQQFVSDTIPYKSHSSSWALLDIFRNLGYFIGPIMAGYLIISNDRNAAYGAILFALVSLVILISTKKMHSRPVEIDFSQVNLFKETQHWRTLFKTVWPVVTLSLFLGIIDAAFWTTGAIWTEELARQNLFGILFIPAYQLPSLFMGFVVAKWGVINGKKKIALHYLLVACLFLVAMGLSDAIPLLIIMVFVSSIMLSVTYPMIEAVYSNIFTRMGKERRHLMGLTNSAGSLSYIVGPAICGFIAASVGPRMTFSILGGAGVLVALILLLVTPKKIKLPQSEMESWDD
ncbi:MAG: MFS transporter [Microgenomates group bacterium]